MEMFWNGIKTMRYVCITILVAHIECSPAFMTVWTSLRMGDSQVMDSENGSEKNLNAWICDIEGKNKRGEEKLGVM